MKKPEKPEAKWSTAWLIWLVYFLVVEIPAAILKKGGTFSENVWHRWFDTKTKRWVLAAFGVLLFIPHFVYEASAWWSVILPAIPVGLIIIRSEIQHRRGRAGEGEGMKRSEWDAVYDRHFKILFEQYPDKPPDWRQKKARERTRIDTGMSRPSLLSSVKEKLGMKLLSSVAANVVKKVAEGEFGEGPKKAYWWLAGKKTWLSIGLFALYSFVHYILVPVLVASGVAEAPESVAQLQAWVDWIPAAVPWLIGFGLFDAAVRIEPPKKGMFVTPPKGLGL